MPFCIARDEFTAAIERLVRTCERKSGSAALPHFFYIRFDGYGNKLKLSAYNSMRRAAVLIDDVGEHTPFSFGVSAPYLDSLRQHLPKSDLMLSIDDGLTISSEGFSAKFAILSGDRFPQDPVIKHNWKGINYEDVFSSIGKISYFKGGREDDRVFTKAVCVTPEHFMCTDGYRISLVPNRQIACEEPLLLPMDSVNNLISAFSGLAGDGYIEATESEVYFTRGKMYMATRLLAGTIPDYKSRIPYGPCTPCAIARDELKEALLRMNVFIEGTKKLSPLCLRFEEGKLHLLARRDGHRVEDTLSAQYGGGSFTMFMDMRYLLQAVQAISGPLVHMELRGEQMTVVITDDTKEHKNVVQPIRGGFQDY